MRYWMTKLRALIQRSIAIWGVDNDIRLFDDEKWERQALHPKTGLRAPANPTSRKRRNL